MKKMLIKTVKAIFFPHPVIMTVAIAFSVICLVYSIASLSPLHPISLLSYLLCAYSLTLICCALPELVDISKKSERAKSSRLHRLINDMQARTTLSLYGTFFYNSIYAGFQLLLGLYHRSVWFLSIATYYVLLAIMRFSLLYYSRSNKAGEDIVSELKRFRFCGILLLLMNTALSAITFYITLKNQEFLHHGATTVALAAFTVCSFTLSMINIIKYRKQNSPLLFAAKLISFVSAIVSMLSLETALIGRFATSLPDSTRQIITGVSAFVVLAIIAYIGIFMTATGSKQLAKLKAQAPQDESRDIRTDK